MPMVIEIVDEQAKVEAFQQTCSELIEQASCGGLVTLENIRVIRYRPGNKS
jgi:PII-like signaling protein